MERIQTRTPIDGNGFVALDTQLHANALKKRLGQEFDMRVSRIVEPRVQIPFRDSANISYLMFCPYFLTESLSNIGFKS